MIVVQGRVLMSGKEWGTINALHDFNFNETPEKCRAEAERQVRQWAGAEPHREYRVQVVDRKFFGKNI